VPQVVVVNPKKVTHSLQALVQDLRANPGKYNHASAGPGSSHHLAGELFKLQTKHPDHPYSLQRRRLALQDLIGRQCGHVSTAWAHRPAYQGRPHQGPDGGGRCATPPFPMCPALPSAACRTSPSPPGMGYGRPRARLLAGSSRCWTR
jgi:hypothetical protein